MFLFDLVFELLNLGAECIDLGQILLNFHIACIGCVRVEFSGKVGDVTIGVVNIFQQEGIIGLSLAVGGEHFVILLFAEW